jgi:hypothetical protein
LRVAQESLRAAAILAVSSLEGELEKLILMKFPRDISHQTWKTIAGAGPTPLGSFKAKNEFAHAFGFYGARTKNILEAVSSVRNKFAHTTDARSFDHPKILPKCVGLATNEIAPFHCDTATPVQEIRVSFLKLVEILENRLEEIRGYLPELGDQPPVPLP